MSPAGPLEGVRVVEFGGMGGAPFAAMLIAELGADVIRIERPGTHTGLARSAETDLLNRGKRSIALDLKDSADLATACELLDRAEIALESYRPGVVERLGIGPAEALERNPALVYGRLTGWGQDGPLAPRAGHDINFTAVTGALHTIGVEDGPPAVPHGLLGDFAGGGMYAVAGLLAALISARATGAGQVVDIAIVDGVSHLLASTRALVGAGNWVDRRGVNLFDGGAPWYATYETSDGKYMAVGAVEPQFFAELLRALELDPATRQAMGDSELRATLADAFRTRPQAAWVEHFSEYDACVSPVLDLAASAGDPHLLARGTIATIDGIVQPAPAPRFSSSPTAWPSRAPWPGEHTDQIRAELSEPRQRPAR